MACASLMRTGNLVTPWTLSGKMRRITPRVKGVSGARTTVTTTFVANEKVLVIAQVEPIGEGIGTDWSKRA